MLLEFLSQIPVDELWKVAKRNIKEYDVSFVDHPDREHMHHILFSLYSFSVLSEPGIRRLLVAWASPEKVELLAQRLECANGQSTYDMAVAISLLPWKRRSAVVEAFHAILKVPKKYLPTGTRGQVAIEDVDARRALPPLYDYQKEIQNKIVHFLAGQGKCYALMQLPTGAGKTRTALDAIAAHLKAAEEHDEEVLLIWMAHTEELCEQAIETFKMVWTEFGAFDARLGRYWGGFDALKELDELDVLVSGYQKMVRVKGDALSNQFRERKVVLVIDEAHKALAPTVRRFLAKLESVTSELKVLGLTATPGRSFENDRENIALRRLFKNHLITSKLLGDEPIRYLQDNGILAKVGTFDRRRNILNQALEENDLGEYSQAALKKLAKKKSRNELIVEIAASEIEEGRRVLLFACNVEHSKILALMLAARGYVSASVDCTMRRADRRRAIEEFKGGEIAALVNFGILTTGYDDPTLDVILIARPTKSIVLYSQMIGRALRGARLGGTQECRIIDIQDQAREFGAVDDIYRYFDSYWS